ncbi:hypothetical protein PVAND_015582 [Polypedilum vanderplanki]|uniref:RING-type domain-containing protein n=1 Tax=Polypedilum vanderplanki TaxID=319348 RepID=A0A9J6BDJ0_POLVA|nr:hypothetical protein PVAND_015582 [Polypedilum vanderplanki]
MASKKFNKLKSNEISKYKLEYKQQKIKTYIQALKLSELSPIHFKLINVKDSKAKNFSEKCIMKDCPNKKIYCPIPCGHYGLCESCICLKNNNECDICNIEAKEWIKIINVDETDKCTMCCTEYKKAVFLPCKHFSMCFPCVDILRNQNDPNNLICPYCRSEHSNLNGVIFVNVQVKRKKN